MSQYELRNKSFVKVSKLLIKDLPPAVILQQLLGNYIQSISFFSASVLPFFSSKSPTNIRVATKLSKLLRHPAQFDHIKSVIGYLNTNPTLVEDELIGILGGFFSLFEPYSIHLSDELKNTLGVEDIFLPKVNEYIDCLVRQEQWQLLADLEFIPDGKLLTSKGLLSQPKEVVITMLNKFSHLFSDLNHSSLQEILTAQSTSDPKLAKEITQLSHKLKIAIQDGYTEKPPSQEHLLFCIRQLLPNRSSSWLFRQARERWEPRIANLASLQKLKPFITPRIKPQILSSIVSVLKEHRNCVLNEDSQFICLSCFDILVAMGDIFTKKNLPDNLCEEVVEILISFLQNNSKNYYVEEGVIKSLSALNAIIPLSRRDLVSTKLTIHLPRFNHLIFSTCSALKGILTETELTALTEKWSSSSYFEPDKIAQDALPLLPLLQDKKRLKPVIDRLQGQINHGYSWDYEKTIYHLLFQYKSITPPIQWAQIMKTFKEHALIRWHYPGLLERVYEFKTYLPQEDIWEELSKNIQKDAISLIKDTKKVLMIMEAVPEAIDTILDKLFNLESLSSYDLNAL